MIFLSNRDIKQLEKLNIQVDDFFKNETYAETKFIKDARKHKLEYVTGLSMFLGQAQESFKIWFNIKPSLSNYLIFKLKKDIKMI